MNHRIIATINGTATAAGMIVSMAGAYRTVQRQEYPYNKLTLQSYMD